LIVSIPCAKIDIFGMFGGTVVVAKNKKETEVHKILNRKESFTTR